MPKGIKLTDDSVKKILLEHYPKKVVFDLSKMNDSNDAIYRYILRKSKNNNVTVEKYLESLGFVFIKKRNYDGLIIRLLELYPNRIINDSITKHKVYRILAVDAFNQGITVKEYLKKLNFTINKNLDNINSL